ncbi:hypothetical protein ATCC90586_004086 [Pythium insidiosum]|nr:hypothetical protein ATCC90586_004086 [Pythium insidiosum]
MEVLPSSPSMEPMASPGSKKRRRSIEPLETSKIIGLPLARGLPDDLLASVQRVGGALAATANPPTRDEPSGNQREEPQHDDNNSEDDDDASTVLRRSLMGLSLQLKLKTMLVEAWASDMNSVVIERNLFAIAKELAILRQMGVYDDATCVQFLELARHRMEQLLAETERREALQMEAHQMWTMATMQAQEKLMNGGESPVTPCASGSNDCKASPTCHGGNQVDDALLRGGFDACSRDISVLWKAMSIARDRGAQLWHENKPEQALPFLVAADSYMKRFTLKYQRLKIDHAMLDTFHHMSPLDRASTSSSGRTKRVSFAAEPEVLGTADSDVDRSPICPTKPSRLESLLLRTSREFPTPVF